MAREIQPGMSRGWIWTRASEVQDKEGRRDEDDDYDDDYDDGDKRRRHS
jgi:hypothetical protein